MENWNHLRLLIDSLGKYLKSIKEGKVIMFASPHPTSIIESEINTEEVLGISTERDVHGNKKKTVTKNVSQT